MFSFFVIATDIEKSITSNDAILHNATIINIAREARYKNIYYP